jgi:hypothetical protein
MLARLVCVEKNVANMIYLPEDDLTLCLRCCDFFQGQRGVPRRLWRVGLVEEKTRVPQGLPIYMISV